MRPTGSAAPIVSRTSRTSTTAKAGTQSSPVRVTIDDTIEARRALERLAELPPQQRRDLALRVAGFTYREIAEITGGRTYTNVNKHLRKARARIRLEELRDAGAKTRRPSSS
jgi:DNA-directed RNA polymerase specialized sigma24 family protein